MNDSINYAKFCKVCGEKLTDDKDREKGKHKTCGSANFCCYCGKSVKGIHSWNYNSHYTTCSNECICNNQTENMEILRIPLKTKYPTFSNNLIDWINDYHESYYDRDEDVEEDSKSALDDAFSCGNYVILFQNSDMDKSYEILENDANELVLKHIIKSRHRKCIGMGCNEYVSHVVKNNEEIDISAWAN